MAETKQFLKFCAVGGVGFLIDAGLTIAITHFALLPAIAARIPAFVVASLATYSLNRSITFAHDGDFLHGWGRYLTAGTVGALLNYLAYAATLALVTDTAVTILVGIAAGSIVGLGFNYWAASRLIFRRPD